MQLIFYCNFSIIKNFSWQEFVNDNIGLSGTDWLFFKLLQHVSNKHAVILFHDGNAILENVPFEHKKLDSLSALSSNLKEEQECCLTLISRSNSEFKKFLQLKLPPNLSIIVWDHNGPYPDIVDLLNNCKNVKRIVCVSQMHATQHRHRTLYKKITFIHNFVDIPAIAKRVDSASLKDNFKVCYMGSLTESKGFHHLVKAWPSIKKILPCAQLDVYGSAKLYDKDSELGDLKVASKKYEDEHLKPLLGESLAEISKNGVYFKGLVTKKGIYANLHQYKLGVVNPNLFGSTETFCVSAVEIQAAGVPTIGARRVGLMETIKHNETGLTFASHVEMERQIIQLLSNDTLNHTFSKNAMNRTQNLFAENIAYANWDKLFDEVKNKKKNTCVPIITPNLRIKEITKTIIFYINKFLLKKLF